MKDNIFFFWLGLTLPLLGGCQPTHHISVALPPKLPVAVQTAVAVASTLPWKPFLSIHPPADNQVQPWTPAQVRQLSVKHDGKTLSILWRGAQISLQTHPRDKRGLDSKGEAIANEAPYAREVSFSDDYSLSLPAPKAMQLSGRLPSGITLRQRNTVIAQFSMEQTFRQWIKEGLISHSQANEYTYQLNSQDLSGAFPSVQSEGGSALAIVETYRPMECLYMPETFYLVRLLVTPQIMILPVRELKGAGAGYAGIPFSPRLYLLNNHLLLHDGGVIEAIQPDGKRVQNVARL